MNVEYIKREVILNDISLGLGIIDEDVLNILNYFTNLFENLSYMVNDINGDETWYNDKGQWIFKSDNKHKIFWVYYYEVWEHLSIFFDMKSENIGQTIKFFVEYIIEHKVYKVNDKNYCSVNRNSFEFKPASVKG